MFIIIIVKSKSQNHYIHIKYSKIDIMNMYKTLSSTLNLNEVLDSNNILEFPIWVAIVK